MSTQAPHRPGVPHATGHIVDDQTAGIPTFEASGGDWSDIAEEAARLGEERIVVNMGPQHPSTHGVLRLMLEIEGETVTEARAGIGYLHTGIEKNMEFRTWTQGVTFCTRMDYVAPLFQEAGYCLAVEKLLGITDDVPEKASVIRVLMMELNRIASHFICLGTGGNELGATTIMTLAFQGREHILQIFELITGLRMNHAYIRPGGVVQDLPPGAVDAIREALVGVKKFAGDLSKLMTANPILKLRYQHVGYLNLAGCMALGMTGPILRSAGLPYDVRKANPYSGYETYDFDVPTATGADAWDRMVVRFEEAWQSVHLVEQCLRAGRAAGGRDQRGGGGDRHGADDRLPVLVGGVGGDLGLVDRLLGVVRVPGAQWGDAHRGAVAPRSLAVEETGGQFTPVAALPDEPQEPADGRAVAAVEVMVPGEGTGQGVLVGTLFRGQDRDHGAGHLRVVGPLPGRGRQLPAPEERVVVGDEEL